jgi:CheY-like chemotaxis protein
MGNSDRVPGSNVGPDGAQLSWKAPPSSGRLSSRRTDAARRILVIDDNPAIQQDFRKILCPQSGSSELEQLAELEADIFGDSSGPRELRAYFELYTASQGREGYEIVTRMQKIGRPIALAFIDMRMPPGWDGVETTVKLWALDPNLEIAICSAYSDYSWHDVIRTVKRPELRLLRKPFESHEVLDLAWELTSRWVRRRGSQTP